LWTIDDTLMIINILFLNFLNEFTAIVSHHFLAFVLRGGFEIHLF
jgi:hypothetical protein